MALKRLHTAPGNVSNSPFLVNCPSQGGYDSVDTYPGQPLPRNRLADHINRARVHPLLRCLQPDFDQIERMPHHHRTHASYSAPDQ